MQQRSLDVILLAYNEVETIEKEARSWLNEVIAGVPGSRLVIAEDGSDDGTTDVLAALHRQGLIHHNHSVVRRGYRQAFLDALKDSQAEHVFLADTGLKQDIRDFWALWPYRHDYALIVGHKVNRRDSIGRRVLTKGYNMLIRAYFGLPEVYDADSGFRLLRADFVTQLVQQDLLFKDLLNSEISIRAAASGSYLERPISYSGRSGASRGLPPREIPRKVAGVLHQFPALKKTVHFEDKHEG